MERGELYYAFTPSLKAARKWCARSTTEEEKDAVLHEYPWIERPINIDYGYNIKVGSNVFINFNCTILDTYQVSIGSRTLVDPNVSFFSGAGSVVTKDILPHYVAAGNAARILRKIEQTLA
ncbi:trimeric LpxA-like protein [Aspergillus oleicola]